MCYATHMTSLPVIIAMAVGLALGYAGAYFLLRGQQQSREKVAVERERAANAGNAAKLKAELDGEKRAREEARVAAEKAREEMRVSAEQSRDELRKAMEEAAGKLARRLEETEALLKAETEAKLNAESEIKRIVSLHAKDKETLDAQLAQLREFEKTLQSKMDTLARQALEGNNKAFLELAGQHLGSLQQSHKADMEQRRQQVESMVKPLGDSLSKFNETVQGIEKQRAEAYGGITQELKGLREAQLALRSKADDLTNALRGQPTKWGRWGELQLRNVVEMAGMLQYCDFIEQETVGGDEGAKLRPDMIVKLPNDKRIAVDSKAPVEMYIASMEIDNEEARRAKLNEYAAAVRKHMTDLTKKAYWDRIPGSPEFVVMFLPGESFFSAALEADPSLIEMGVEQRVILATPTTLIALLRAVAYGWKQEQLAENARHISDAGAELVKRLRVFAEHLQKVGTGLSSAVGNYNEAVGSLERRVLPQARRMQELGAGDGKALPEMADLELAPRKLDVPELFGREAGDGAATGQAALGQG
jgi:DNA recombination protein RmuC